MSAIQFAPAVRSSSPARICLYGPGGSGKTWTSLMLMDAFCEHEPFAVIDTERGKAAWYEGVNGWRFSSWCPQTFSPESLTEALGIAAGAGFPGVIIDSWSHFWNGAEGMLEQVDLRTAAAHRSDKFSSGWKEMGPIEQRMLGAILSYPGHVIVTLRVQTKYVVEEVEKNGRTVSAPRQVGLKPIQREGFEYEFDIIGGLDRDCTLTIDKTRVPTLQGAIIPRPDPELVDTIQAWLTKGRQLPGPLVYRQRALADDVSFYGLRDLLEEVTAAGLGNAPVVDGDGNPTVLAELVKARATVLRPTAHTAVQPVVAPQPLGPGEPPGPTPGVTSPPDRDWDALIAAYEAVGDLAKLTGLWKQAGSGRADVRDRISAAAERVKAAVREKHMSRLFMLLREGGVTAEDVDRPRRLRFANRALPGRASAVTSYTDLTAEEVTVLTDLLAGHQKKGRLTEQLTALTADPAAEVTRIVEDLLTADDVDDAASHLAAFAARDDAGQPVTALLTEGDREALGLDADQVVSLLDLGELVVGYADRHGAGPRVALAGVV